MTRRRLLLSATAVLALAAFVPPQARAADITKTAADFVDALAARTIGILRNKSLDKDARVAALGRLFLDGFDVQAIGRFALGRYWTNALPREREEYLNVFKDFVVQTYAIRFNSYAGELFKVTGTQPDGDNGAIVTTDIGTPGEDPARVDWRVRQETIGLKIVDVVVEGVSLVITQRSEFAAVLESNSGNLAQLTAALKNKITQLKSHS